MRNIVQDTIIQPLDSFLKIYHTHRHIIELKKNWQNKLYDTCVTMYLVIVRANKFILKMSETIFKMST